MLRDTFGHRNYANSWCLARSMQAWHRWGNGVANALTHFWSNCCAGLADANFELIDCPVLSAVYAVLQIPPEKEIARRQVGRTGRPLDRTPPADPSISELGIEPRSHVQCVVCWCPILLEVEPPAHKIRPQKLGKHRQVSSGSDITIKKDGSDKASRSHSAPNRDALLAVWNLHLQFRICIRPVSTIVLVHLTVKSKLRLVAPANLV